MGRKLKSAELRAAGLCHRLGVMVSRGTPRVDTRLGQQRAVLAGPTVLEAA